LFWNRQQDADFATAFRDFGIDIDALDPAAAAAAMTRSSIRRSLVKGLDQWVPWRQRALGDNPSGWRKLIEIARLADPDPWRNLCREALLRRDRQSLEKLADEVPVSQVPPATLWLLGITLRQVGALDKAMDLLRRAQQQYPSDLWINDTLGAFSLNAFSPPRTDDALRYYSIALALRPSRPQLHWIVGAILFDKGAKAEAVAEWSKAIELDPRDAGAWYNRGVVHENLKQWDKALADYTRAIELEPKFAWAWNGRGAAHAALEQYDEAIADHSKAIELNAKEARSWWQRGSTYASRRQWDEALADCTQAIKLDPNYAFAWYGRGWVYENLKQWDKALADHTKAIQLGPNYAFAWYSRGWVHQNLKQWDKALADYTRAIELDPKNAPTLHNRGDVYAELGQPDRAIADYTRAISLDPNDALAHNSLAWQLATAPDPKMRDPGRALMSAKKAVELAPKEGAYWNTLGVAHYRAGEYPAAVAALKKSLELQGANSHDGFILAMCHEKLGEKAKARDEYDLARRRMDKNNTNDEELWRFRAEAANLLKTETFQVVAVSLEAEPVRNRELAPERILLRGKITANGPCTVTYTFLSSDNARSLMFSLSFDKPGVKEVSTTWGLPSPGSKTAGWRALQVLAPHEITSNRVQMDEAYAEAARQMREAARAAWEKTLAGNPQEHEAWNGYAEFCLLLGNEDAYRRSRAALLARFSKTTDPVVAERTSRACLLLPTSGKELEEAAALADRAIDLGQGHGLYPFFLAVKALADYRRGRFESAIASGEKAGAGGVWVPTHLILAMAHQRLGHTQQARQCLDRALTDYDWNSAVWDGIIYPLRREAEALIVPAADARPK
jgi:tetratricopeptide (TPR) repeat protein